MGLFRKKQNKKLVLIGLIRCRFCILHVILQYKAITKQQSKGFLHVFFSRIFFSSLCFSPQCEAGIQPDFMNHGALLSSPLTRIIISQGQALVAQRRTQLNERHCPFVSLLFEDTMVLDYLRKFSGNNFDRLVINNVFFLI